MKRWKSIEVKLSLFAIGALLTLAPAGDGRAEDFAYPNGRIGEIAKAYVMAFSSGDSTIVINFYNTYLSKATQEEHPLKDQLWRYEHLHNLLGAISPEKVIESKPSSVVLLVRSETLDSYFQVGIELDSDTPPLLSDAYIRPAPRPK